MALAIGNEVSVAVWADVIDGVVSAVPGVVVGGGPWWVNVELADGRVFRSDDDRALVIAKPV